MKGVKYLKRFDRFIEGLSGSDRIALIYHTDADGICSALVAHKALVQEEIFPALVFNQGHAEIAISDKTLRKLKKKRINKAIFVDLCVDQNPKPFRNLEEFCSVLVIDHHKFYNDLNSKKTVMVKSSLISGIPGSKYPASKLAFDLFSRFADLRDCRWIAALGVMGDMGLRQWRSFVSAAMRSKGLSMKDMQSMQELIGAVETISPKNFRELFLEFLEAEGPRTLLKSKLFRHVKKFKKEAGRHISAAKKKAEHYPKAGLVLYSLKSRYEIKSAVINRLSRESFPGKTVVVMQENGSGLVKFSARRQDFKIRVNDLLEECVKGLKGASAGGHIPAAAGKIRRADLPEFRRRLVSILEKKSGKGRGRQGRPH